MLLGFQGQLKVPSSHTWDMRMRSAEYLINCQRE